MGMAGEEHVSDDNTVWVTKTHYPEPGPPFVAREFTMDRVIVIVRNPLDAIPSYLLLRSLGSHSLTCQENISEAYPVQWDQWVRGQVLIFKQYHAFLIDLLAKQVPVYFFRYEDQTTTQAN